MEIGARSEHLPPISEVSSSLVTFDGAEPLELKFRSQFQLLQAPTRREWRDTEEHLGLGLFQKLVSLALLSMYLPLSLALR